MEQGKKKVYISAPISGYDLDERKDTFMKMEVRLKGFGFDVFNPLGIEHHVDGLSTYDYMRKDLEELIKCDAILFLDGWNRSAGCHTELTVAVACGIDVWFDNIDNITYKQ